MKATKLSFALIVAMAGLIMAVNLTLDHDWGGDFSAYIMQAKSISEGNMRAFVDANRFAMEQSSRPVGPFAYPWGFPMLLSMVYSVCGLNLLPLKMAGLIAYLSFLVVLWLAFRKFHTTMGLLCLISLFALNPVLLSYSNRILSDLPFLFVSTLCIWLIGEIVVRGRRLISPFADLVLIGTGTTSAYLIRTNGVLILMVLALAQMVSYRRKQTRKVSSHGCMECEAPSWHDGWFRRVLGKDLGLQSVPYVIFFAAIAIVGATLPDGGLSHASHLQRITMGMVIEHLLYYLKLPSAFFFGIPGRQLFYLASIPFALAGAVQRYRSDYPAILYIALTILLYASWPDTQGVRFLFPVFPFYLSFACSGLEALWNAKASAGRPIRKAICLAPVFAVIVLFYFTDLHTIYRNHGNNSEVTVGPFTQPSREMFSFIANHTDSDSVIVFFKPRVMRLMTGRPAIMVNRMEHVSRGDYLCFYRSRGNQDQVSDEVIERLLSQRSAVLVYTNQDFDVYRLLTVQANL